MKLSRRRLLGVFSFGIFAGGTVSKVIAEEKPFDYTDLYVSRECYEDIMNWNVVQIDEQTRKEIYNSPGLVRIYG